MPDYTIEAGWLMRGNIRRALARAEDEGIIHSWTEPAKGYFRFSADQPIQLTDKLGNVIPIKGTTSLARVSELYDGRTYHNANPRCQVHDPLIYKGWEDGIFTTDEMDASQCVLAEHEGNQHETFTGRKFVDYGPVDSEGNCATEWPDTPPWVDPEVTR